MVFNARNSKSDIFYTPLWVTKMLCAFIDMEDRCVWEPSCGEGHITKVLRQTGAIVYESDIDGTKCPNTGSVDFLETKFVPEVDCIITNPPFSLKTQFISKCIDISLPFALLMPVQALEKPRTILWEKCPDLTLIIPDVRISYINGGCTPSFSSAWFCSGFKLNKQLIFTHHKDYNLQTNLSEIL